MEGVRTTAELLGTGLSAGQIRRMVRNGTLCSLRPGVYATAATVSALTRDPRDERARQAGGQLLQVAATLAVTSSRSVGSHRSAALVHGLGLVGSGPKPVAEITKSPGDQGSYTGRRGVLVHIAALPAKHVVSYRGVLLTSVPRTVIDLARTLPFAEYAARRPRSPGGEARRRRGLAEPAGNPADDAHTGAGTSGVPGARAPGLAELTPGTVGRTGLDPAVNPADPVGQRGARLPVQVSGRPVHGQ